jgi:hypothetical protein
VNGSADVGEIMALPFSLATLQPRLVRVARHPPRVQVILIEQELSGGEFDHVHLALIGRFITPRTRITSCNRQVDNAWKQADSGVTSTDDGGPIK